MSKDKKKKDTFTSWIFIILLAVVVVLQIFLLVRSAGKNKTNTPPPQPTSAPVIDLDDVTKRSNLFKPIDDVEPEKELRPEVTPGVVQSQDMWACPLLNASTVYSKDNPYMYLCNTKENTNPLRFQIEEGDTVLWTSGTVAPDSRPVQLNMLKLLSKGVHKLTVVTVSYDKETLEPCPFIGTQNITVTIQ